NYSPAAMMEAKGTTPLNAKGRWLPTCQFLSHIEQELPVLLINLREKPFYLLKEAHFLFLLGIENQLFRGSPLAQVWQDWFCLPFVEELKEGDFQCCREALQGFERRHRVAVLHSGDITTQESGTLFNVALG